MGQFWLNPDGLNVHFGDRYTGEQSNVGEAGGPSGAQKTLTFFVNAKDFTAGTATYNGTTLSLPAGVVIKSVTAEVITAFTLTGTTPAIVVGKAASFVADKICTFTQAQAQAVAPLDLTSTQLGVFAAATPLLVATTVSVGMTGTTPTVSGAVGRIQVMVRYEDPVGVAG